jgi:hypothetical protein
MIIDATYVGNLEYFSDLIYLPFRQIRLFIASIIPGGTGLSKTFDPTKYPGPSIDSTGDVVLPDGSIKEGNRPASAAELARGVYEFEKRAHPTVLPAQLADVEFGDERQYIKLIARMANSHGVKIAFLFVPYYTGTRHIEEEQFYSRYGPVWNAGFLASRSDLYADYGHLTRTGAHILTDWVALPISAELSTGISTNRPN